MPEGDIDLFVEKADCLQFIDLLQETADLFHVNVAAFCLMPTHYHLIDKEVPASKQLAPDLDTIISEVSRYSVRRGIENEPRDVAMYLIRSMRTESLMRVVAAFGLNRYSSVSSAVRRVKTKLQKDRKFKTRLEHIESNILKGQK